MAALFLISHFCFLIFDFSSLGFELDKSAA